ncbi:IclR family transcriptional regulator [Streptomyces clavuligerus]|uniref:IclR family transcriptional regulator n=1 Tax=Streptomyces clavuligerus TaxID=1901 RepID=D5SJG4_STRCL|nr:helix-turn-helix domain-containing protein [Streptomyces clavuligerus]EFG04057.1 IclR family transcriptional regulator [Streptomyces clavuligerus]MBY6307453.1 helix-turn-helix domain-containing protein [Streptomyces clavuligerus]QCS09986.1 IclR family transcriptional regulator [Streptomyces clavuligerus]QPJ97971.1 helix-turn-helix domain-containing protein [Streptomyces clavuligerus]WDN56694.1 helix-turn-helix domain-containing protein [Streptomyces clavuligerus]
MNSTRTSELPASAASASAGAGRLASRLLCILRAVRTSGEPVSLTTIVQSTGLAKSTAHRLLTELHVLEMVHRDGEFYSLGKAVLDLSRPRESEQVRLLRHLLKPVLLTLYERTRHIVGLSVRDGTTACFVELIYSQRYSSVVGRLEQPTPLHRTPAGKVILAHTEADRARPPAGPGNGWAGPELAMELAGIQRSGICLGPHGTAPGAASGIATAAVPVLGAQGQILAALSAGGHPEAFDPTAVCALLRQCGAHAHRVLRHVPEPARD